MAGDRWIFTKSQLMNTPSRKCGTDSDKELSYRQQAASLIQDMGQRLQVPQLCINTAIVYMHRFYMVQSFQRFHHNQIALASLFLAAKVEEQPRKLEHVIKVAHHCIHRDGTTMDIKSDSYSELAQELVVNENIMLQTLGFDITVDHPHTNVVKTCQMVREADGLVVFGPTVATQNIPPSVTRPKLSTNCLILMNGYGGAVYEASKDLAQTSYFLATNSLHLTVMCLQYKPTVVASVCVHLACKWSNWELPKSSEGKEWYTYVDKSVTLELLEELTQDFLDTLDKCPSKLRKKIMTWKSGKMEREDNAPPPEKKVKAESTTTTSTDNLSASTSKPSPEVTSHVADHKDANHSVTPLTQSKSESKTQTSTSGSQPTTPQTGSISKASDLLRRIKSEATIVTMSQYKERREKELGKKEKESCNKKEKKLSESGGIRIHIKTEPGLKTELSSDRKSHSKHLPDGVPCSDIKLHIKKETVSHHGTISPLKIKVEPGAHVSPLKMKIKSCSVEMGKDAASPLKMKIKHPKLTDKNQNNSSHHPSTEKLEKQSSHSSRNPSSSHSSGSHERHSLKLKLTKSDAQKHSGHGDSHSRSGTNGKADKNRTSHRQSTVEVNSHGHKQSRGDGKRAVAGVSRSQLGSHTVSTPDLKLSISRKRANSPATDNISDYNYSKNKVTKSDAQPHTLARSSSSHSVHSMDLSDNGSVEDCLTEVEQVSRNFDANGSGTNSPVAPESKVVLNQQLMQLQHIINRQMSQIAHLQHRQQPPHPLQHQQSLFDLDYIEDIANPPLPNDSPARPPTPPLPHPVLRSPQYPNYPPPPPPPHF